MAPSAKPPRIAPARSPSPSRRSLAGAGWMTRAATTRESPSTYQPIRSRNVLARPSADGSSYSAARNEAASRRRRHNRLAMPSVTRARSSSSTGRPRRLAGLAHAQDGEEGLLRDLHRSDALHALLAFLLLLQQLPLPRDVATVALGEDVLAHRADGLPRHHGGPDRGLHRHLEHLARDELLQLLGELPAGGLGLVPVHDQGQGVHRLAVHQDVELDEARRAVAQLLVVHRRVALAAALELVEVVDDQLRERHLEGEEDPGGVEVLHAREGAPSVRGQLHERTDVGG